MDVEDPGPKLVGLGFSTLVDPDRLSRISIPLPESVFVYDPHRSYFSFPPMVGLCKTSALICG